MGIQVKFTIWFDTFHNSFQNYTGLRDIYDDSICQIKPYSFAFIIMLTHTLVYVLFWSRCSTWKRIYRRGAHNLGKANAMPYLIPNRGLFLSNGKLSGKLLLVTDCLDYVSLRDAVVLITIGHVASQPLLGLSYRHSVLRSSLSNLLEGPVDEIVWSLNGLRWLEIKMRF